MQKYKLTWILALVAVGGCEIEESRSGQDSSVHQSGGDPPGMGTPDGSGGGGTNDSGSDSNGDDDSGSDESDGSPIPSEPDGGGERDADMPGKPDAETEPPDCSAMGSLSSGSRTIRVGGTQREYLVHIPRAYSGSEPVPLVLDFHPLLSNATSHRNSSGYRELSEEEGFIVAYPNGINPAWNVGPCCTRSRDVDDVSFARAVVDELKKEACIDPKRVYAVGYSNGGGMSHHLACNAADVFAAVSPAAFDLLVEDEQPCHPSRPITVKMYRSTNDSIVPYRGGASTPPTALLGYRLDTIHFEGAEGTFERWGRINQCTDTPTTSGNCKTYASCAAGVQVTLCTTSNGHVAGPADDGWATLKQFTLP